MRLMNIFILLFLLSAFAIGTTIQDADTNVIHESLTNASMTIQSIELEDNPDRYVEGMLTILEKYIHLAGVFFTETMRMGIFFGQENPEYFEPIFILKIIRLIVWLTIIGLLIKPLSYLVILIALGLIWLKDKIKERKEISNSRKKIKNANNKNR